MLCSEASVPMNGLVLRESYRQLRDSTLPTYNQWLGELSTYVKDDETAYLTIPNIHGDVLRHSLHFRHARRESEASNLLSTEYSFIWLEEPVPAFQAESRVIGGGLPEGIFKIAFTRLRQAGAHRRHLILSFNPPSNRHWVYETFFKPTPEKLANKSYALFRQPKGENKKNLPEGYYEQLAEILGPELAKRFVDGEVVHIFPGRPVFQHFREDLHFRAGLNPIPNIPFILAIDFGHTPCCLFSQLAPSGRLLVYKEMQLVESGTTVLAERINATMKNEFSGYNIARVWADPAGNQRAQTDMRAPFDILRAANIKPVIPGPQAWNTRYESVDTRSLRLIDGEPAILIDKDGCPYLMEGLLGGYRYDKSRDGRLSEMPLKNMHSHLADSLQYLCGGEFAPATGEMLRGVDVQNQRRQLPDPLSPNPELRTTSWMAR